jgi:hypothetical protein
VNVVGLGGGHCYLLVLMIEHPPFLSYSYQVVFIHIYNAIQYLLQWLQVIRMLPHPDICHLGPERESVCCWLLVLVVGIAGGSLLVLMFESPHSLHTHIRSSLYIYNAIQRLLQWLVVVVISMQFQPDICSMEPESGCPRSLVLGVKAGFSVGSYV